MGDGFGTGVTFVIKDDDATERPIGAVGAIRQGADDSGTMVFRTALSGSLTDKMYLTKDGYLGLGGLSAPTRPLSVGTFGGTISANFDGWVGVKESTPYTQFHVSDGGAIGTAINYRQFWGDSNVLVSANGVGGLRLMSATDTATDRMSMTFIKSRGTLASPVVLQENDRIGDLLFGGVDSVGGVSYGGGVFGIVDADPSIVGGNPVRISFVTGTNSGDRLERLTIKYNGLIQVRDTSDLEFGTTTGTKFGTATSQKIGFWNATPVVQQVTNAYTSDGEGTAYTGIDNAQAGTPYAQLTDLNQLRVAYETLRASYDDLLTKLKNTGIVA
jgi:hypothetical protein